MYFKNFPDLLYRFNIGDVDELKLLKDITTNVRLRNLILQNITLFDEYDIKEGETPEIISAKLYGSSQYHWVIMLLNERYDYIKDFPMSEKVFEEYVANKYANPFDIKHYIDSDGYIVPGNSSPAPTPVTFYDYESQLNESKRRIKLISNVQLGILLKEFNSLL